MKHTINYATLPPDRKAEKAIADTKAYLGDQFGKVIELVTQSVKAGEVATRKQVHFALSFIGVHGYPVDALVDKYWPTLPA